MTAAAKRIACRECGTQMDARYSFCTQCGTSLASEVVATPEVAEPKASRFLRRFSPTELTQLGVVAAVAWVPLVLGALRGLTDNISKVGSPIFDVTDGHFADAAIDMTLQGLGLFGTVIFIGYMLHQGGSSFTRVGLPRRPAWVDVGIGFGLLIALFIAQGLGVLILHGIRLHGFKYPVSSENLPLYFLLPIFVLFIANAFYEETLVCGYFQSRLDEAGYSPRTCLLASAGVRTLYHLYYGFNVLEIFFAALVFALMYAKTKRLWPNVLAHAALDIILALTAF